MAYSADIPIGGGVREGANAAPLLVNRRMHPSEKSGRYKASQGDTALRARNVAVERRRGATLTPCPAFVFAGLPFGIGEG